MSSRNDMIMPFHYDKREAIPTCYFCPENNPNTRVRAYKPMATYADSAVNALMMPYNAPMMQNVLNYRALNSPRNIDLFHFENLYKPQPMPCSTCYGVMSDTYLKMAGRDCQSCGRTVLSEDCSSFINCEK